MRWTVVAAAVALCGCSGTIGEMPGNGGGNATGGGAAGGGSAGGSATGGGSAVGGGSATGGGSAVGGGSAGGGSAAGGGAATPLALVVANAPVATQGMAYSFTLTATGGTAPYSWSETGALPSGLSLDASSGAITGMPTATGTFGVSVKVTDASSQTSTAGVVIVVSSGSTAAVPMPVISWGVPAFANSGNASAANDGSQQNAWDSGGGYPCWLAYDLSGVPQAQRQNNWISWWNTGSWGYDSASFGPSYNLIGDYTIEVNSAAGGTVPTSGWQTLATVTGNVHHTRSHLLSLAGANWIRIHATQGATMNDTGNNRCVLAMDVHDASAGIDAWHFMGDSITAMSEEHVASSTLTLPSGFTTLNFGKNINSTHGTFNPAWENDGVPFLSTSNYPLSTYLPLWPGKYVAVQLGANNNGADPTTFYNDMLGLIDQLLAAGKTVFVATPSWQSSAHQDMSQLAAQVPLILQHYQGKPVYPGPDMYAFFSQPANQGYITSNDGLHPNDEGRALMRDLWAQAAMNVVYK